MCHDTPVAPGAGRRKLSCRSSVVEHSLGRLTCLPGWKRSGENRPKSGKANGPQGFTPTPSQARHIREGVEARRAAPTDLLVTVKGWSSPQTEGAAKAVAG